MSTSAQQARTLADYRPQHDEECESRLCEKCGDWWGGLYHVDYRSNPRIWPTKSHPFSPGKPCSCGLDPLLAALRVIQGETPTVEEAKEYVLKHASEYGSLNRAQASAETINAQAHVVDRAIDALILAVRSAPPLAPSVEGTLAEFDTKLRAKFTPALNTGTAMELMILVSDVIREMSPDAAPQAPQEGKKP